MKTEVDLGKKAGFCMHRFLQVTTPWYVKKVQSVLANASMNESHEAPVQSFPAIDAAKPS